MTVLPREEAIRLRGEIHVCDWCHLERRCEMARAGTGYLWICADCLVGALSWEVPDEEFLG